MLINCPSNHMICQDFQILKKHIIHPNDQLPLFPWCVASYTLSYLPITLPPRATSSPWWPHSCPSWRPCAYTWAPPCSWSRRVPRRSPGWSACSAAFLGSLPWSGGTLELVVYIELFMESHYNCIGLFNTYVYSIWHDEPQIEKDFFQLNWCVSFTLIFDAMSAFI